MKKIIRKMLLTLSAVLMLTVSTVSADTDMRYTAVTLYDYSNYRISYMLIESSGTGFQKTLTPFTADSLVTIPVNDSGFAELDFNVANSTKAINGNNTHYMAGNVEYALFPGIKYGYEPGITSKDYDQANKVVGEVVNSFNTALSYVGSYGKSGKSTLVSSGTDLATIATSIVRAVYGSGSGWTDIVVNGEKTGIQVHKGTSTEYEDLSEKIESYVDGADSSYRQGIRTSDFVILRDSSGTAKPVALMWNCPKGYSSGQLYENANAVSSYYSWIGLVSMANGAASSGYFADNNSWTSFDNKTTFSSMMSDMQTWLTTNLATGVLGLSTAEELIFNRDARGYSYYLGMMPYTWFQVSNSIFWIFEIVGVLILLASVLYTVFKQNYAVISPVVKTQIQDHIANTLIAIFLMIIYVPIFYILAKTNSLFVELLNTMTMGRNMVQTTTFGVIIGIILSIVNLVIIIKLNITYLTRAVTITFLHTIAPAAIASVSLTGTGGRSFFNVWLKEMIASIFMQSFNAVIMTMFILITAYGTTSNRWEGQVMLFMFIPLNDWFKQTFTGTTGIAGVAQKAGQDVQKTFDTARREMSQAQSKADSTMANQIDRSTARMKITGNGAGSGAGNGMQQGGLNPERKEEAKKDLNESALLSALGGKAAASAMTRRANARMESGKKSNENNNSGNNGGGGDDPDELYREIDREHERYDETANELKEAEYNAGKLFDDKYGWMAETDSAGTDEWEEALEDIYTDMYFEEGFDEGEAKTKAKNAAKHLLEIPRGSEETLAGFVREDFQKTAKLKVANANPEMFHMSDDRSDPDNGKMKDEKSYLLEKYKQEEYDGYREWKSGKTDA